VSTCTLLSGRNRSGHVGAAREAGEVAWAISDDAEFRARYDAVAPGLADDWRDAITEYAAARLD